MPTQQNQHFIEDRAVILKGDGTSTPRLIAEFYDQRAMVLLGSPGMGKTASFKKWCEQENGFFISARDFITLGADDLEPKQSIFIDGLDVSSRYIK